MRTRLWRLAVFAGVMCLVAPMKSTATERHADKDEVTIGEYRKLYSEILNEERTVIVYSPYNYDESTDRYPVLYVLGGSTESHLMWAASAMEELDGYGKAPLMLVVLVDQVSGARDSRPVPIEGRPNTGKADEFLRFLTEELRPFIDANYRTVGYSVLAGFSNTGLFSSYVCLAHTDAFDTYIASSPMISSCREYMTQLMHDVFASGRELNTRLYMNYGSNDYDQIVEMMPTVAELFEQEAPADLKWTMQLIDDGGHVPFVTLYNGLSFVFSDWRYPMDRLQADGLAGLRAFYADLSTRYGFPVRVPNTYIDDLGFDYLQTGEYDQAIEVFTFFTEEYPTSPLAQFLLGEAHRRKGDTDLARKRFERALEIDPAFTAAQRRLEMLDAEG